MMLISSITSAASRLASRHGTRHVAPAEAPARNALNTGPRKMSRSFGASFFAGPRAPGNQAIP